MKTCTLNWESRSLSEALNCSPLQGADWLSGVKNRPGRAVPRRQSIHILDPLSPHISQTHHETICVPERNAHHSAMRMRPPLK